MAWSDITNGESGSSVRGKLNAIGQAVNPDSGSAVVGAPAATTTLSVKGLGSFSPGFASFSALQYNIADDETPYGLVLLNSSAPDGAGFGYFLTDAGVIQFEIGDQAGGTQSILLGSPAFTAVSGRDTIYLNAGIKIIAQAPVNEAAYTVDTLPATPDAGDHARVTDATAPVVGSAVVGGGAANAMVWWNGTAWNVFGV